MPQEAGKLHGREPTAEINKGDCALRFLYVHPHAYEPSIACPVRERQKILIFKKASPAE